MPDALERESHSVAAQRPDGDLVRSGTIEGSLPPYDAMSVGRVAKLVDVKGIELIGAHFERFTDDPLPKQASSTPEFGITPEWWLSDETRLLTCNVTFGTTWEDDAPYTLVARFRLMYQLRDSEELSDEDLAQFTCWNAVFNAWPYWREYFSSTINRAGLPRIQVPVMGVPRGGQKQPTE
jgi:hypothetical protein